MPAKCRELDTVPDVFVPEFLWPRHLFPPLVFIVLCLSLGLTPLASSSCSALHLGLCLVCLPLSRRSTPIYVHTTAQASVYLQAELPAQRPRASLWVIGRRAGRAGYSDLHR